MPKTSNKPRGKMTAYIYFSTEARTNFKKNNPDEKINFGDLSRKIAQQWKDLNAADKQKFEDMAAKDKKRWEKEMKNYTPGPGEKKGKGKKKGGKKDPNAPKKPQGSFFLFCADFRNEVKKENPEFTIGDVAKELGQRWRDITPEDKKHYDNLAAEKKKEYEKVLAEYNNTKNNTVSSEEEMSESE